MQGMMAARAELAKASHPMVEESSSSALAAQRQVSDDQPPVKASLASILGNLTSKVLLAPVGGRSSFIAPRDANTKGKIPGSGEEYHSQGSTGEYTSRKKYSDRSRDRREYLEIPLRRRELKAGRMSGLAKNRGICPGSICIDSSRQILPTQIDLWH